MPYIWMGTLAGQSAVIVRPSQARATAMRLVVHCHGGDELYDVPTNIAAHPEWQNLHDAAMFLADRGYAVLFPAIYDASLTYSSAALPTQAKGQTFGNDASTTQLANVISAAATLLGTGSGKYALTGHSMGNVTIFNHLRRLGAGQGAVAGALAACPLSDLGYFRGTDAAPGGGAGPDTAYAAINRAHGIGGANGTTACDAAWSPIAAVKNPPAIAASLTTRWHAWTNANDTTAPPSQAVTLAGLIPNGKGTTESRGSGGHDFSGISGKDMHAFFDSLSW